MTTISVFRKLALLGVSALALTTPGCIVDSSSSCAPGAVDVAWVIAASAGAPTISCGQAGAAWVDFTVDGVNYESPCTDYGATISVAGGTNQTVGGFALLDGARNNLSSTQGSMTNFVACGTTWAVQQVEFDLTGP